MKDVDPLTYKIEKDNRVHAEEDQEEINFHFKMPTYGQRAMLFEKI